METSLLVQLEVQGEVALEGLMGFLYHSPKQGGRQTGELGMRSHPMVFEIFVQRAVLLWV